MQGNLTPDRNLFVGALAGVFTKIVIMAATAHGITIDAETQGYLIVIATWLAAHVSDVITGDNKP